MNVGLGLGIVSLAAWLYLVCGRGRFWLGWREPDGLLQAEYPAVVAIVPARNEAAVIGDSLRSLLRQGYPGSFRIVVVDDHSDDGTADIARQAARDAGASETLTVIPALPLAEGWVGKVAAMEAGVRHARASAPMSRYILFTDADIAHGDGALERLVARAEAQTLDLVSLMVRLRRHSLAERALIPAFVFFFRMLYPFSWVNDRRSPVAAAAGGCMLVRRAALEEAGGLVAIKDALIDDCALARAIKNKGAIRLDVADRSESLRGYATFGDVWRLIARTAYAELRYSPVRLAAAVAGMTLVFLVPPLLVGLASGTAALAGAAAWAAMAVAFTPCLRYYGASLAWAPSLPLVALFYVAATVDSWRRHWRRRGGEWKGRFQSEVSGNGGD